MFSALSLRLKVTLGFVFVFALTACGGGGGSLPSVPKAGPTPQGIVSVNGNNIEVTGTVTAFITGGFQIEGGQGVGYLHIYTTSSTVITGPAPFVGENVDVVGTGTLSTGNITATSVKQIVASPSPSPSPTVAPVTATPAPVASVGPAIPLPTGVVLQTATISYVSSTRLTVNGGSGCGSMYVYLNSSTNYFDGSPKVGQYAVFTGTGTRCSSVTAISVSLSSSAFTSTTVSGTVAQAEPYGFLLNTGSGNVPVALTSSTVVFGATLSVGSSVTVTALGTASTGYTATQVSVAQPATPPPAIATPTPGPISMTHVQNFAYIYGYAGTPTTVAISSMSPWVNWTMTDEAHAAALRSAGIKVQVYANYWRNYSTDNPNIGYTDLEPGGAHAAAEATDCSGSAIVDSSYGGGYEADPRTSAALGHAQVVVNYRLNEYAPNYDALFADDTGGVYGITLPCNYDESTWDTAVNSVHSSLGVPMWVNALGGAPNPQNAIDLAQPSNVLGAMCEECYANNPGGDVAQTGTSWENVENAEIGVIGMHKVFWDYARMSGDASSETALRTYAYASFLLSYDPSYAMYQDALKTPSGFPVMPETGFVAENPVTSASSVSGYQQPGGAYMREYGACYYLGKFVSNCAVVVNPNPSSSVPVPTTSYTHSMVLSGYGVLDGGTVGFNGPQVSTLAPASAAILFP